MQSIRRTRPDVVRIARPEVDVVDTIDAFAGLRSEWDALLAASAADSPFLTWDWLHAWAVHLRGTRRLHVVTVRSAGDLIAAAPLATERTRLPWLSRLDFMATGNAGSDYLDVLVRRGFEDIAADALAKSLNAQKLPVRFDHVPSASLAAELSPRLVESGWAAVPARSGVCPVALLGGHTWDTYLGTLGSAHRANVRRRLRALERNFTVRFDRLTSESHRAELLDWLIRVHNERWDARGGSTAFPNDACRGFHQEVTRRALRAGRLRMYALYLNDSPAAATYCLAHNGRTYFYQGAFDDRYRQHAVGLAAMALTIRAAIAEGSREFDLLYGVEPYKWLWARDARLLTRIDLFPAHFNGRLSQRIVEAERALRALARRIFPRRPWSSNARPAGAAC
jgi:CelD/BcsL family acetyltransferase involved in cellulose biosynthesis